LYAFIMGWPEKETVLRPDVGKVRHVELLGFRGKVKWSQDASALRVQMPPEKPCDHAITLRISLA
jgi:alpha-L-fucosidase